MPEDYALVQYMKGYLKLPSGGFLEETLYGKPREYNFPDWVVDSTDEDPVYMSTASSRWNYKKTNSGFLAHDQPGLSSQCYVTGHIAALEFKTYLYKISDVPNKVTDEHKLYDYPIADPVEWEFMLCWDPDLKTFVHECPKEPPKD